MFGGGSGSAGGGGGRDNSAALTQLTQMMMTHPPPPPVMVAGGAGDAEEFPMRDERVQPWSQQETRDFIAIRGQLERDFTMAKRNKTLWEVVAAKMKEIGYRRTPDQCKFKWKNLVTRYKGKEPSDQDNTRSFPFFEDLHALFTERATNVPQTPFEPQPTTSQSKKRITRTDSYKSLEEISEDELEDEDEYKITKLTNPPRKQARTSSSDKPPTPRQLTSGNSLNDTIRDILHDFFKQQQMIDMRWKELMEKHAYERQVFEQEWRQSMERIEIERMRIEQSWREKEEQRRIREESRAERRDALLTALLNKLVQE